MDIIRGFPRGKIQTLVSRQSAKCSHEVDPVLRRERLRSGRSKARVLPIQTLLDEAPRIRVRNLSDRQREQLGELVVANERLAGRPVSKARQRVEFLKRRREVWEMIYMLLTKQDAAATLAALEEAHKKVADAISERSREKRSVGELKRQLLQLQDQVGAAHQQLHHTQELVQLNRERIQQLTAAASAAEPISTPAEPASQSMRSGSGGADTMPDQSQSIGRVLPVEQASRVSWVPAAFSESVKDGMTVFHHAGQPWVLFRGMDGEVACIEDCCAHRACPLSLGKVVNGNAMCAYHGWRYNAKGECTEMPSTMMCPGIAVKSMPAKEGQGIIWVAAPQDRPDQESLQPTNKSSPELCPVAEIKTDVMLDSEDLQMLLIESGALCSLAGGKHALLPMAAKLVLGRAEKFRQSAAGVLKSNIGSAGVESHYIASSQPGQCRWLFQLCIQKKHWPAGKMHQHLWQFLAKQAVQAVAHTVEQKNMQTSCILLP